MVRIEHLTKKFSGGVAAVDDLSLELPDGKIFACIGPNGSGKTTTVKMLAGLYMPTSGAIHVCGIELSKEPEKAKALIGYVPDEPYLYEKMSGREFLGYVAALYGMQREDARAQANHFLPFFSGLEEVLDGMTENYSRGNKQKLAVVAALMHRPKVLFIDEPMVGLDPQSAHAVKNLLKDFSAGGGTVFLCTHTLPVAEELAHRIGVLNNGKLVALGTLAELRAKAGTQAGSLEEAFLELVGQPGA